MSIGAGIATAGMWIGIAAIAWKEPMVALIAVLFAPAIMGAILSVGKR